MDDVCRVCTSMPYDGNCTSTYARSCLQAQSTYLTKVLGINLAYCDCLFSVAADLLDSCKGIPRQVGWLGNCDNMCYYGPKCPFSPTLYSLLSPRFQRLALSGGAPAADKPAPAGSALVLLKFDVSLDSGAKLCYRFSAAHSLANAQSATINRGTIGYTGPELATLFSNGKADPQGCQPFSMKLMKVLSTNPTGYYVRVITDSGSVRGQLLVTPHLAVAATSDGAGVQCTGSLCMAIGDLAVSLSAVSYNMKFTRAVRPRMAAALGTASASVAPITLYSPGAAQAKDSGGVTPNPTTIMAVLTDPSSFYLNITTADQPRGALQGSLSDTLTVFSMLYGYQVVPPSGVSGSAVFLAQIGAGGICYVLRFRNVPVQAGWAYLHHATYTTHGPVVVSTALPISSSNRMHCMQADTKVTGAIIRSAPEYYVQVYSNQFPAGMMRGQLFVASLQL